MAGEIDDEEMRLLEQAVREQRELLARGLPDAVDEAIRDAEYGWTEHGKRPNRETWHTAALDVTTDLRLAVRIALDEARENGAIEGIEKLKQLAATATSLDDLIAKIDDLREKVPITDQ